MREARSELMDIVEDILVETNRENAKVGNAPPETSRPLLLGLSFVKSCFSAWCWMW